MSKKNIVMFPRSFSGATGGWIVPRNRSPCRRLCFRNLLPAPKHSSQAFHAISPEKKGREKCHMTHENNNIKIRKQSLCNYLIFNSHSTPSKLRSSVEAEEEEEDTLSQKFRALKKFPFVNRVFLNFSFVSGKCLPGADGRSEKDFFMR